MGELYRLNVDTTCYARFFGAQDNTAFFQHTITGDAIVFEGVDTIVSCYPPQANDDVAWLADLSNGRDSPFVIKTIGDALAPRTVEEAVLEGFKAARTIG